MRGYRVNRIGLVCALALIVPGLSIAEETQKAETQKVETHKKVQAALDYDIPPNKCSKPKSLLQITAVNNDGATSVLDVDSYQLDRVKRKEKRWQSCLKKYKRALLEDFTELKDSAQYGLTQGQANTILGKMADIQSVIMSVDGIKPVDADNS